MHDGVFKREDGRESEPKNGRGSEPPKAGRAPAAPSRPQAVRVRGAALAASLVVLFLAGAALGAVTQEVVGREALTGLDDPAARVAVGLRTPWLTTVMAAVTWLGSAWLLALLCVAVGVAAHRRVRSWRPLVLLGVTLAGATLLAQLIKLLVARPRPDEGLVAALGYSFPSGHATTAAAVWGALALMACRLARGRGGRAAAIGLGAAVATVVGLTRVYLGVHEATDVLGGWALGTAWLAAVASAVRGAFPERVVRVVEPGVEPLGRRGARENGGHGSHPSGAAGPAIPPQGGESRVMSGASHEGSGDDVASDHGVAFAAAWRRTTAWRLRRRGAGPRRGICGGVAPGHSVAFAAAWHRAAAFAAAWRRAARGSFAPPGSISPQRGSRRASRSPR
ncbi:phosphatase PAP2 family protein [Georgenia sp. AZ-5]|uniref:phosphatase PAP2 family protein n=1 Tax=Georgenia sp. AZ-5 TaxID=3367526 RepID=UPI0037540682